MQAELSNCVWIPKREFSHELRQKLTVEKYEIDGEATEVQAFRTDRRGWVGIPRVLGLQTISTIGYVDKRTAPAAKFPKQVPLYDYQEPIVNAMQERCSLTTDFIVRAATGKGKCLAKGTPVLMYDGRVLPVECVKVGDQLMGADSKPRTVLTLARGREEMYQVTPTKGDAYTVNRSHILSLKITGLGGGRTTAGDGRQYRTGDIVDISIEDYLASSPSFRHVAKGWRTGVEFAGTFSLPIPPYILGTWLGDGASYHTTLYSNDSPVVAEWQRYADSIGMLLVNDEGRTVGTYRISSGARTERNPFNAALAGLNVLRNKHIPHEYKVARRADRLALLAGLVDTDGCVSCGCFDIVFASKTLADDTAFLARSLGFAAYIYPCTKRCQTGAEGLYYRIRISGDIAEVPCRLVRKQAGIRQQKKNVMVTGISVEPVGEGEYFGFEIDGDRRFLLGDFTVTHNTVMGLALAARLGLRTVVIVDQETLLDQWIERATQHLGLKANQIGIVQGPRRQFEGKPLTICMMQTLVRKEIPEGLEDHFGLAIFDESHTTGAPTFSQALMAFSARHRIGLSATPNRKDTLQRIITWNLGHIQVQLLDKPERSSVYIRRNPTVYSWRANAAKMTGRYIEEIAEDGPRNLLIADSAKWLYETGRDVLVISDRIEQLCSLMALTAFLGVPRSDMGLYAKGRSAWIYEKDPTPPRQPEFLEKGCDYSPVRLALVQKTIPKKTLQAVKERARIIFATYGIMAKGVDIPRLAAGIDATPRSDATQVHGRTLRAADDKLRPIWVTIEDFNSYRSLFQLERRIADYIKGNAEIFLWEPEKGRKRLDPLDYRDELSARSEDLRERRIIKALDGTLVLV